MTDINLTGIPGTPGVNGTTPGQAGTAGGPGGDAAPAQNTGNGIDTLILKKRQAVLAAPVVMAAATAAGRAATPVRAAMAAMPRPAPARRSTPSLELQVRRRQPVELAAMPVPQATCAPGIGTMAKGPIPETVEQRRPRRLQRIAPVSRAPQQRRRAAMAEQPTAWVSAAPAALPATPRPAHRGSRPMLQPSRLAARVPWGISVAGRVPAAHSPTR